jgi:hypothetical protein
MTEFAGRKRRGERGETLVQQSNPQVGIDYDADE